MKITILGSGTSTGVPQVGCTCPVCTSTDPRDKRLRCSGLIESGGVRILVDCGPDFREQSLRLPDFQPIDGVLITHEHYDHVGGLDDLRPFCHFHDVPVYAEPYTAERLMNRIPYCFAEHPYPGVPRIPLVRVEPNVPFQVVGSAGQKVEVLPLRVVHGRLPILGFRIGNVAWITDMTEMPEETYAHLEGLLRASGAHPSPRGIFHPCQPSAWLACRGRVHASTSRPFGIRRIGDRGIN